MTNVVPLTITPDSIDFRAYMIKSEPHAKVLPVSAWRDDLIDVISNGTQVHGAKLPWRKTHDNLRFRPGETTLWFGSNGSGKSLLLGMACLGFAAQGERVCIASFEMTPKSTLIRMMRQVAMNGNPPVEFVDKFVDWATGRIWVYNQLGQCTPEMIELVIRYCADKLNINHFVIDSLMRVVPGEDSYNQQKDFVGRLCSLVHDIDIHIHLVHHIKNPDDESKVPNKFEAKGSGSIADQVDQCLGVWRNKLKQRAVEKALRENTAIPEKLANDGDALLVCDKNRHGEWEGRVALWYHASSLQYTGDPRCIPINFMGNSQ